jgi:hypothetical protein
MTPTREQIPRWITLPAPLHQPCLSVVDPQAPSSGHGRVPPRIPLTCDPLLRPTCAQVAAPARRYLTCAGRAMQLRLRWRTRQARRQELHHPAHRRPTRTTQTSTTLDYSLGSRAITTADCADALEPLEPPRAQRRRVNGSLTVRFRFAPASPRPKPSVGGPRGARTHNPRIKRTQHSGDCGLYLRLCQRCVPHQPHHRALIDVISCHEPCHADTWPRGSRGTPRPWTSVTDAPSPVAIATGSGR